MQWANKVFKVHFNSEIKIKPTQKQTWVGFIWKAIYFPSLSLSGIYSNNSETSQSKALQILLI